jgi:hypothetical protein
VNAEGELEAVLAFETTEIATIELGENDHDGRSLLKSERKLSVMIIDSPRHGKRSPLLGHFPIFVKQPSAIESLVLLQEVII